MINVIYWLQSIFYSAKGLFAHQIAIQNKYLRIVAADNEPYGKCHLSGFNGISELNCRGETKNLFFPEFSGLNFEHIFSGDESSFHWSIFEPRLSTITLKQLSSNMLVLKQKQTEHWPLTTRMQLELDGDGINFSIQSVPLRDVWSKHGYIGLFFASYINAPEEKAIHFIGRTRPGMGDSTIRWIKHLPEAHGVDSNHRPMWSEWDPTFDPGFKPSEPGKYWLALVYGISTYEYAYPFYYGLIGDKVVLVMFQKTANDEEIRFAQSPTGGAENIPAWDFIFFKKNYRVDEPFGFNGRLVYKPYIDKEDIILTYEKWSGEKVREKLT